MIQLYASISLTLRELWAARITQGVFVVTTLAWVMIMFALNLDVVEGSIAAIRILGIESNPLEMVRDPETGDMLRQALSLDKFVLGINQLVFGASYVFGTLLGLFTTMPIMAGFLETGRLDLLLSKPLSRSRLLLGHISGVTVTVLGIVVYLILSVWAAISFKTGIWEVRFLMAIPIIVIMFLVMYGVVLLIGVWTRNTGLGLVTAYGLIFFSVFLAAHSQITPLLSSGSLLAYQTIYHVFPNYFQVMSIMAQLGSGNTVSDWYPLFSSLLFGGFVYVGTFILFQRRDY
jgi:ABC-2 type transport system permease protein